MTRQIERHYTRTKKSNVTILLKSLSILYYYTNIILITVLLADCEIFSFMHALLHIIVIAHNNFHPYLEVNIAIFSYNFLSSHFLMGLRFSLLVVAES